MSYNDLLVMAFKVLKYVDEFNKAGKYIDLSKMRTTLGYNDVPTRYWNQVIIDLIDQR